MAGLVVLHHGCELQGIDRGFIQAQADDAAAIANHHGHGLQRQVFGSGNDIGSYPYIDDVVDGHIAAMEKGRSGERYILGGVNASFNELMSLIKKYTGTDRKLTHIPFFFLDLLSRIMLLNAKLTGKPPMITPDWVAKYKYDWALDSSKAIQELGYRIRPLEDGVRETIEWIKENRM